MTLSAVHLLQSHFNSVSCVLFIRRRATALYTLPTKWAPTPELAGLTFVSSSLTAENSL
jgi:hypothetical protein